MTILKLCAAAALSISLAACSQNKPEEAAPITGAGAQLDPSSIEYFNVSVGDRVFFETDSSSLTGSAQATLRAQAQWLLTNASYSVTIEGHADERGTREYNLALGARRANAVVNFLAGEGVPAGRLNSVTFGREKPVAVCSAESCWSQNRRGVTVVATAPTS